MLLLPRLLVAPILLAYACSSAGQGPPAHTRTLVPVLKVSDGDTIHVRYHGEDERVRLIGVNTPEVSWYGGQSEGFGEQAGKDAPGRLIGHSVEIAFHGGPRGRYGRLLAHVDLGAGPVKLTPGEQR